MTLHEYANLIIRQTGAKSYLQIGSARGLDEVTCPVKRSVHEPADAPTGLFDVVFVDPPMDAARAAFALQVGFERLALKGVLLVANVAPSEAWQQEVPPSAGVQLGQVWRTWIACIAGCLDRAFTLDEDHGLGVYLHVGPAPEARVSALSFEEYAASRAEALRLVREVEAGDLLKRVLWPAPTQPDEPVAPAPDLAPPAPRKKRRDR